MHNSKQHRIMAARAGGRYRLGLRSTLLSLFLTGLTACLCACSEAGADDVPAPEGDGTVTLSLDMKRPAMSRAFGTNSLAENISTLRVVIVDLGLSADGTEVLAEPSVEYNQFVDKAAFAAINGATYGTVDTPAAVAGYADSWVAAANDDVVRLTFPRIRADRKKKIYFFLNADPVSQSYLDMRLADGTPLNGLYDEELFLPDASGRAPIEEAVFKAPEGSYTTNYDGTGETLYVPMTSSHDVTVPPLTELEQKFPTISKVPIYPLESELFVVHAQNKITFEFINNTGLHGNAYDEVELLVREWTLTDVNRGDSYLFAHLGDNGGLFDGYTVKTDNLNAPWMQWLYAEASRSQTGGFDPQWLTAYDLPAGAESGTLVHRTASFNGDATETVPTGTSGLFLPLAKMTPATMAGPIYFSESHSGNPQQYELAFTVWQREPGTDEWKYPFVYKAKSTVEQSGLHLLSLFRDTHVHVKVTFVTGRAGVEMEVEVHPYGSVELNPDFGL